MSNSTEHSICQVFNVSSVQRPFLALFSALLLFLASPGQFSFASLAWVALIPLLISISGCQPYKAAKLATLCGFFYYCAILYWILIVLGKYGNLPLWITLPALFILALYMSAYLALFAAILSWIGNKIPLIWIAPPLWVTLDLIRGHLFTGFPWLDLGYSQYQFPQLIQVCDITGHFGITFLIILVNYLIIEIFSCFKESKKSSGVNLYQLNIIIGFLIILATFSYSFLRYDQVAKELSANQTIQVGLIQGNIDQSEKWLTEIQEKTVSTYLQLSEEVMNDRQVNLLIWPETALPFFPYKNPLFTKVTNQIIEWQGPSLITGAPHYTREGDDHHLTYYNSAFALAPSKATTSSHLSSSDSRQLIIERYDKQHLVPFGEYIPFGKYLPESMPIVHSIGNFSHGESSEPISCHNANIGLLICYESIFPDLARKRVKNGANIIVNITNDAWYGNSSAPWQQLAMVVFRSIENRRSLARAANTGISCFIDPLGRQIELSPLFKRYTMTASLPLLETTSIYSDYGHFFSWLCLMSLIPIIVNIQKMLKNKGVTHVCGITTKN